MSGFWSDPSVLFPKQQHRWIITFGDIEVKNGKIEGYKTDGSIIPPHYIKSVDRPNYEIGSVQAKYLYSHTINFNKRLVWKPINLSLYDVQEPGDSIYAGDGLINNFNNDKNKVTKSTQTILYNILERFGYFSPDESTGNQNYPAFKSYHFKANIVKTLGIKPVDLSNNKLDRNNYISIHELYAGDDFTKYGTIIETWRIYNPLLVEVKNDKLDYTSDAPLMFNLTLAYDWAQLIDDAACVAAMPNLDTKATTPVTEDKKIAPPAVSTLPVVPAPPAAPTEPVKPTEPSVTPTPDNVVDIFTKETRKKILDIVPDEQGTDDIILDTPEVSNKPSIPGTTIDVSRNAPINPGPPDGTPGTSGIIPSTPSSIPGTSGATPGIPGTPGGTPGTPNIPEDTSGVLYETPEFDIGSLEIDWETYRSDRYLRRKFKRKFSDGQDTTLDSDVTIALGNTGTQDNKPNTPPDKDITPTSDTVDSGTDTTYKTPTSPETFNLPSINLNTEYQDGYFATSLSNIPGIPSSEEGKRTYSRIKGISSIIEDEYYKVKSEFDFTHFLDEYEDEYKKRLSSIFMKKPKLSIFPDQKNPKVTPSENDQADEGYFDFLSSIKPDPYTPIDAKFNGKGPSDEPTLRAPKDIPYTEPDLKIKTFSTVGDAELITYTGQKKSTPFKFEESKLQKLLDKPQEIILPQNTKELEREIEFANNRIQPGVYLKGEIYPVFEYSQRFTAENRYLLNDLPEEETGRLDKPPVMVSTEKPKPDPKDLELQRLREESNKGAINFILNFRRIAQLEEEKRRAFSVQEDNAKAQQAVEELHRFRCSACNSTIEQLIPAGSVVQHLLTNDSSGTLQKLLDIARDNQESYYRVLYPKLPTDLQEYIRKKLNREK